MPKLILVPRLCPAHCFTSIKKCYVTPILQFSTRKKPNGSTDFHFHFHFSVKSIPRLHRFYLTSLCDWVRKLAPFCQHTKLKAFTIWSPASSRAFHSFVIFTLACHWLLKVSSILPSGCCDCVGLGFTTLARHYEF